MHNCMFVTTQAWSVSYKTRNHRTWKNSVWETSDIWESKQCKIVKPSPTRGNILWVSYLTSKFSVRSSACFSHTRLLANPLRESAGPLQQTPEVWQCDVCPYGLKHWQFLTFWRKWESAYEDVLYFFYAVDLSTGETSWRGFFFYSRAEMKAFMEKDGCSCAKWFRMAHGLAILVDITQVLKVLNKNLQEIYRIYSAAYDKVRIFSMKCFLIQTSAIS